MREAECYVVQNISCVEGRVMSSQVTSSMTYLVNWRDDSLSYHPLEEQVTSTSKGSEKEPLAPDKPGHCSSALSDPKDLGRD